MDRLAIPLLMWLGFSMVAGLTWFFSSRPRLFIRIFCPAEELWTAARGILKHGPDHKRAMRFIALLQFAAGSVAAMAIAWFSN